MNPPAKCECSRAYAQDPVYADFLRPVCSGAYGVCSRAYADVCESHSDRVLSRPVSSPCRTLHHPSGNRRSRPPVPCRYPAGHVRPFDWTRPQGSLDLSALRARRMAVRRHAAGSARSAGRRVALRELQLAASGGAGGRVPGAVCDLSRNQPGTPVRRLLHVLELRRGLARRVRRRAQAFRNNRRLHRVGWRWSEDGMAVAARTSRTRNGGPSLHSEIQFDRLRRRLHRLFGRGFAPWPV